MTTANPLSGQLADADATRSAALPTGTVTFLLTDVEGSTKRWEADAASAAVAVARHYEILDHAIIANGGVRPVEQGEGDSVVGAFARASDALAAAVAAQRRLAEGPWPDGRSLAVRMAVHTGEAWLRDEGNYFGQAIIRCARLRACGWGGQVLLSQTSADLVRDHLPVGVSLVDLGRHRLKDLQHPEQVWQAVLDELPRQFPPLASLDTVRHNLPLQATPLVGRERELAELAAVLAADRTLTLTGSGGCGKTRLACEMAARVADRFPGGVTWVELAPSGDIASALSALAARLGVAASNGDLAGQIAAVLTAGGPHLLVLDNAEHLLDGVAGVVASISSRAPQAWIVTTSREPLGVPGEVVWRVPSLTSPPPATGATRPTTPAEIAHFEAVELFVDRARRSRRGFAITDDNAAAVAQICSRLDGVPLAIELAAARVRTMPPERIAAQLDDRFRLLAGGPRTALPRQQTLQASIAWSEGLLDDVERTVFARLGVFVGGFKAAAAEDVVGAFGDIDAYAVADVIGRLVDKSLVQFDEQRDRYSLLETIRSYALERLLDRGETSVGRDAQAEWCARWLEERVASMRGAASVNDWWDLRLPVTAAIDDERPNCVAALAWTPPGDGRSLRLVAGLGEYWAFRGDLGDSNRYGMAAILAGDRADPAWLEAVLALHGPRTNDLDDEYRRLAAHALVVARERGDERAVVRLSVLAGMPGLWRDGPTDATVRHFDEGRQAALEVREWYTVWNASQTTAGALSTVGRTDEALAWMEGLRHSRVDVIATAVAQLRGQFDLAIELLHRYYSLSAVGRAPHPDDLWARFRLSAVVLATGRRALIDEFPTSDPAEVERMASSYQLMRHATAGLGLLIDGDDVAAQSELRLSPIELLGLVRGRIYLPQVDLAVGDTADARVHALELRIRCEDLNAPHVETVADLVLAECAWPDDLDGALGLAHQALAPAVEHGLWPSVIDAMEAIGSMLAAGGRERDAARLLAAAQSGREELGYTYRFAHRARYVAESVAAVGGDDGWQEGAGLALPEAVAMAQRMRGGRLRPARGWDSLTPTELAVVEQVVAGLTNPQIADQLLMGKATVKSHLLHVFRKLGVANRSELVAVAIRRTQKEQ